jgi:hypothetical protein
MQDGVRRALPDFLWQLTTSAVGAAMTSILRRFASTKTSSITASAPWGALIPSLALVF